MISVEYVDHMGDDLRTVDAARYSFDKASDWEYEEHVTSQGVEVIKRLSDSDARLINYLGRHSHWTTAAHNQLTLRIKLPIWLARQFTKHQIGAVVNEMSRRYVDSEPEVWWPTKWRSRPTDGKVKQGSGGIIENDGDIDAAFYQATSSALNAYEVMISKGVAPEQARTVLPLGTFTTLFVTGSLVYWARMYNQRAGHWGHPQAEWTEITDKLGAIATKYFPHTWRSLTNDGT